MDGDRCGVRAVLRVLDLVGERVVAGEVCAGHVMDDRQVLQRPVQVEVVTEVELRREAQRRRAVCRVDGDLGPAVAQRESTGHLEGVVLADGDVGREVEVGRRVVVVRDQRSLGADRGRDVRRGKRVPVAVDHRVRDLVAALGDTGDDRREPSPSTKASTPAGTAPRSGWSPASTPLSLETARRRGWTRRRTWRPSHSSPSRCVPPGRRFRWLCRRSRRRRCR